MKEEREKDELTFLDNSIKSLKKSLHSTAFGRCYVWFLAVFSGLSTIHFIYTTYADLIDYSPRVDLFFACLFAFDWALNLLISDHPMDYILRYCSFLIR
jgi:hypothetical protein